MKSELKFWSKTRTAPFPKYHLEFEDGSVFEYRNHGEGYLLVECVETLVRLYAQPEVMFEYLLQRDYSKDPQAYENYGWAVHTLLKVAHEAVRNFNEIDLS